MPSGTTTEIRCSFPMGAEAWSVSTLTDKQRRVVEGVSDCYQIDESSARVTCMEECYRI